MAWIESHQDVLKHPKTRRLSRALNISLVTAVGHLHVLWWWALDFASEGDLGRYNAQDIADAAFWEGDPESFVQALEESGYIDREEGGYVLHDWYDYAGKLIDRRKEDAARKRSSRSANGTRKDVRGMSGGRPEDVPGMSDVTVTVPIPQPIVAVASAHAREPDTEVPGDTPDLEWVEDITMQRLQRIPNALEIDMIRGMIADGVDPALIRRCIDESFDAYTPKHSRDEGIATLTYCRRRIWDTYAVESGAVSAGRKESREHGGSQRSGARASPAHREHEDRIRIEIPDWTPPAIPSG